MEKLPTIHPVPTNGFHTWQNSSNGHHDDNNNGYHADRDAAVESGPATAESYDPAFEDLIEQMLVRLGEDPGRDQPSRRTSADLPGEPGLPEGGDHPRVEHDTAELVDPGHGGVRAHRCRRGTGDLR